MVIDLAFREFGAPPVIGDCVPRRRIGYHEGCRSF